ncbi:MAG TPA: type I glutamate--ammonia ligase [Chloroflexi bacterium]|nr:type I glutamate--ammonia ligase [Chloroflexota bacterium]HHW87200.1 type I glutamate--ammonia ligase [Chloroflexota bacterium]
MSLNCSTAQDVTKAIAENNIEFVDLKFTDLYGQWQHFSVPVALYDEDDLFKTGLGFDGSSIRGFKSIESSDMLLVCDPTTAFIDPVCAHPTLSVIANVYEPGTMEAFARDPRNVIRRAEAYLKSTGIADTMYCGPEAEFFIFDQVMYETGRYSAAYGIESSEAVWTSGEWGPGHKVGYKGGYFPVAPFDLFQDIRSEMVNEMIKAGLQVERHHHEVATAGQTEIDLKFAPMIQMADWMQIYKYIVKNVAAKYGKTATFMPKPLFEDNGSGMHVHQSLWKEGKPVFAGDQYAGLSQEALWYIGGILKHINSLLAICAPTTNSYRRLVPGYEAPVVIAYSARNRSAACRIPVSSQSPKAKRVEFRCPDPAANPYLAFSAMLMAGLDGIKNQIDPGKPSEMDLFEGETLKKVRTVEGSLSAVLDALEADHDYLLAGGVFTEELIETYIHYKRIAEFDAVRLRPHPHEFVMYYGV